MLNVYDREGVTCIEATLEGAISRVYLFLVDGILIDTGAQVLEAELRDFYPTQRFNQIVLTHGHEDHVGTAALLSETTKAPIYLHPNGIEACQRPADYLPYRQVTWGLRRPFRAQPLGSVIDSGNSHWDVIETPGHADDHVVLHNPTTGTLFSGDLYLAPKAKVMMPTESVPVQMDSLRKMLTLEFDHLFCSHAGYVENGKAMIARKLEFFEDLSGEVLSLHERGLSVEEIDATIFPHKPSIVRISQGEYDSVHMIRSVVEGVERWRK